jgi:hypothetical protein
VAGAAKSLNGLRDSWLNPPGMGERELRARTLTNLYNVRPSWLALAYDQLDRAVHGAYGWPYPLEPDEVLARLVSLNLSRQAATEKVFLKRAS